MNLSGVKTGDSELGVGLFPEYEIWSELADNVKKKFRESRLSKWLGMMGLVLVLGILFNSGKPTPARRSLHIESPELNRLFLDGPAQILWDQAPVENKYSIG